jgi:tetrahydromethanopterin S-methyltransferase subunit G
MKGEDTDDRLSRIEERLDRIETLVRKAMEDGRRETGSGDAGEPLDVDEASKRLDQLGERIDETKRKALGGEATAEAEEPHPAEASAEEPPAEGGEAAPEGDVRQAKEVVGEGPSAPG